MQSSREEQSTDKLLRNLPITRLVEKEGFLFSIDLHAVLFEPATASRDEQSYTLDSSEDGVAL